jgi:hypothetical protein
MVVSVSVVVFWADTVLLWTDTDISEEHVTLYLQD